MSTHIDQPDSNPGIAFNWDGDELTVAQQTQTPYDGRLLVSTHGSLTMTGEEWLDTVVNILQMLLGKLNREGSAFLLGPVDADPDMIGALIAAKLRDKA